MEENQSEVVNEATNDSLHKYVEKSVELELAQELCGQSKTILNQRKIKLLEEKKKLDELHLQIFHMETDLYDSVWKLAADHDHPNVLNGLLENQPRQTLPQMYHQLLNEIEELMLEIEAMQAELKKKKCLQKKSSESLENKKSKFILKTKSKIAEKFYKS